MSALTPWFLLLHVGAAIVAFGPTFVLPLIGRAGAREPMHGNFALRISEAIEDRIIIPFALSMPVTGVLLILSAGFDLTRAAWLDVAIVIYIAAISLAIFVQRPAVQRMVALTGGAPGHAPVPAVAAEGPGTDVARPPSGGPSAGGPPAGGPPPEFLALAKQVQRNGMILAVAIASIVFLMVVKPTF
jgi:uncharacterized membrane protein